MDAYARGAYFWPKRGVIELMAFDFSGSEQADRRPSTTELLNLDRMRLQKQILDLDIR